MQTLEQRNRLDHRNRNRLRSRQIVSIALHVAWTKRCARRIHRRRLERSRIEVAKLVANPVQTDLRRQASRVRTVVHTILVDRQAERSPRPKLHERIDLEPANQSVNEPVRIAEVTFTLTERKLGQRRKRKLVPLIVIRVAPVQRNLRAVRRDEEVSSTALRRKRSARIVRCMRPRIRSRKLHSAAQPMLQPRLQSVVMRRAIVDVLRHVQPLRREELRARPKLLARVVDHVMQMIRLRAHIGDVQHRVRAKLLRKLQVVLLNHRVRIVLRIRNHRDIHRVRLAHRSRRRRQCSRSIDIVVVELRRCLSRERHPIALLRRVLRCAVKLGIIRKHIADSAAIQEVVNPVSATNHRLAGAIDVIRHAESRCEVVTVCVDQAARVSTHRRRLQRTARDVEVRLTIVLFVGAGKQVVAQAQVQRQFPARLPVVLHKETIFHRARLVVACRIRNRIVVDKRRQHLRNLVPRVIPAAALEEEEPLGPIVALEEVNLPLNHRRTGLQRMLAPYIAQRVEILVRLLRHLVRSAIARVPNLRVIPANQRAAAQQGVAIRIHDSQVRRNRRPFLRIDVPEVRT